jgi:uncharacterized repeat protein (TIGR01451 family)
MPLQGSGEMSFADVYNEMTGESLANPPISITLAELGQLQNSSGQTIPLNQYYTPRPDGSLPTVFPTEWYLYCQRCNVPNPYLTISKSGATAGNLNQSFSYFLTITNNGTTATTAPIQISDYLQEGLVYITYGGEGWNITVQQYSIDVGRFTYNVFGTYNGVLQPNGVLTLQIIVQPNISTTYYNYATVSGGGEAISKTSNTTTTLIGGAETWTSSVTKRLVRTIQKNDCGEYGVGSYQEVYSPFFTATYTSSISQADADTNANNQATALCNQWLDANGQSVANQYGTCTFGYPNMTLSKTMPGAFNINQSGTVRILMRIFANVTSGQIVMSDVLPSGFEFVSMVDIPSPFSGSVSGKTVTFTTSNSLPIDYYGEFVFTIRGITVGNYTNFASAYGGNIINNYAQSNTVSTYIFGEPSFSFTSNVNNNSFIHAAPINATPTDEAYYNYIITIGNQPSTNSTLLAARITLPGHLRIVDHVSVFINETYFFYSQGLVPNELLIFQRNNVTVPVGQYLFSVRINLLIDYYRMSSISQPETGRPGDNLIINSSSTVVPRRQITNFKGFVSGTQVDNRDSSIDWANNYQFLATATCRDTNQNTGTPINFNDLTWDYSINDRNNPSQQFPLAYDSGINIFTAVGNMYAINPVRDSWTPATPFVKINTNYPYQDGSTFSIRIYYRIFYQGTQIQTAMVNPNDTWVAIFDSYEQVNIDKASNEPKLRNIGFKILLNTNGTFRYW